MYRVLMLIPFYLINEDWGLVKAILSYFEIGSALDCTNILLLWVSEL
jgi:hypothetical protein